MKTKQKGKSTKATYVIYKGSEVKLIDLCRTSKMSSQVVKQRLAKGLTIEEAISPDKKGVRIIQLTVLGEFVAEFASIARASIITGINQNHISQSLDRDNRTAGSFMWQRAKNYNNKDDNKLKRRNPCITNNCKEVVCVCKDGAIINKHSSIKEAARSTGIPYDEIRLQVKYGLRPQNHDSYLMLSKEYQHVQ